MWLNSWFPPVWFPFPIQASCWRYLGLLVPELFVLPSVLSLDARPSTVSPSILSLKTPHPTVSPSVPSLSAHPPTVSPSIPSLGACSPTVSPKVLSPGSPPPHSRPPGCFLVKFQTCQYSRWAHCALSAAGRVSLLLPTSVLSSTRSCWAASAQSISQQTNQSIT